MSQNAVKSHYTGKVCLLSGCGLSMRECIFVQWPKFVWVFVRFTLYVKIDDDEKEMYELT